MTAGGSAPAREGAKRLGGQAAIRIVGKSEHRLVASDITVDRPPGDEHKQACTPVRDAVTVVTIGLGLRQ